MTTAARPTWAPAKGGQEQGGARMFGSSQKFSARDLASHTVMKVRQEGQGTTEEIGRKDLRQELEARERKHYADSGLVEPKLEEDAPKLLLAPPGNDDADDVIASDEDESDKEASEDDEEDENQALMAEMERIRRERAEEAARKEAQKQREDAKAKEAEMLRGNPLLNPSTAAFGVKRKWYDDPVFKNQARGENNKQNKRFINDTIRNDFHRKFLAKYMK